MKSQKVNHFCRLCDKVCDHNTLGHRCLVCGLNHNLNENLHVSTHYKRLKLTFDVKKTIHDGYCSDPGDESDWEVIQKPDDIYYLEVPSDLKSYEGEVPIIHYELRKYHLIDAEGCKLGSGYCGLGTIKKLAKAEIVDSKKECDILRCKLDLSSHIDSTVLYDSKDQVWCGCKECYKPLITNRPLKNKVEKTKVWKVLGLFLIGLVPVFLGKWKWKTVPNKVQDKVPDEVRTPLAPPPPRPPGENAPKGRIRGRIRGRGRGRGRIV